MRRLLLLLMAMLALVAAGCGSGDGDGQAGAPETAATTTAGPPPATPTTQAPTQPAPSTTAPPDAPAGTTVRLGDSQYGQILFDGVGQAIYLFDRERSSTSECYGDCAAAWPPVLTDGSPQAGRGTDPTLLATTERTDGTTQVTYNGHPLYYYAHEAPNEVLCHRIPGFGGIWLVLDSKGDALP